MCCEVSPVVCEWERIFLSCFNLMTVEMNGLSVGGCLFGMVIWVDFLLLEHEFLMVEVVVVEVMDVV